MNTLIDEYNALPDDAARQQWTDDIVALIRQYYSDPANSDPSIDADGDGISVTPTVCAGASKENAIGGTGMCGEKTAQPIYFMTGDKEQVDRDFSIGGLSLTRSYHSQSTHSGRFGYGWTWDYGWQLTPPAGGEIKIRRADGKLMNFKDDGTGTYVRRFERMDEKVVATADGWRYTKHDRSTVDFDAAGNLVSLNSEDGQSTTVAYDAGGNPVSVTDPFGRSVAIAVDGNGRISTITGPTGRVWTYGYDANGNLTSVTWPNGTSRQYAYGDANDIHNLTQVIDEAGRIYKQVTYDTQDRAVTSALPLIGYQDTVAYNADGTVAVTESDGRVVNYTISEVNGLPYVASRSDCGCGAAASFTYDSTAGFMLGSTDKLGISTAYTYDADGHVLTMTEAVGTAVERTTSYAYDPYGHVTGMTDGLGNTTAYTYDAAGHLLTVTDPLGHTTTNVWNTNGTLASRTDANGNTTAYAYDNYGQVITVTNPDWMPRHFAYDGAGRITLVTNEAGSGASYAYDVRDRVTSATLMGSLPITNSYDAAGDLVSTTDAAGLVTTYTWDVEHRPLTMTRPDGSVVTSTFNAKGNLTARDVRDAAGVSALAESMAYDADGRLLSITHADATSVSNTYDMVGRLLTVTDEAGKVTTNGYDELGRLTSVTNPNGEIAAYAYDANDHLIRATAANGVTTTYAFDAAGRLIQEASSDRGVTDYGYDAAGNLISKSDANGVVTSYTYDNRNRLTAIHYPSDPSRDVGLIYDPEGRVIMMSDIAGSTNYGYDPAGRPTYANWMPAGAAPLNVNYFYDMAGRLFRIIYPSGRMMEYSYGTDGRIASVTANMASLASGITYNALDEVTGRTLGNGINESRSYDTRGRLTALTAGSVLDRALTWSADSRITAITDNIDPYASQSFGYDPADRLTSATGSYGSLSYTYDANGNRLSRTDAAGTVSSSYEANTNRLASSGTTAFSRDAAGNRTADNQFSYTYGVNNRLIAVASGGNPLATYLHNGRGERVKKTVNGVTTFYLYDLSGNLIGEYDASGNAIREHVYGVAGRLASFDAAGNTYFHHNDHLGTPQALTNSSGIKVWAMSQTPFGIATVNEDPDGDGVSVTNNFRFPGQYFDAETGLYYNMNRSYDPANGGRYTQSDPIGLNGGMNTFTYVDGNPIIWQDKYGLFGDGRNYDGRNDDWLDDFVGDDGPYIPKGHSDFYGNDMFDYTKEDHGWSGPVRQPRRHFRNRPDVERDLRRDIRSCDKNAFERHMHQGQDYFPHYSKGYRWPETLGHAKDGHLPDYNIWAWDQAESWTKRWIKRWDKRCDCGK